MNDKILEICMLQTKMYEQMTEIDAAVLRATKMDEVVDTIGQIVKDIQSLGYTEMNIDRIKSCEELKEFCNVDLCLKYKSVEALSIDAVKEAFKKFCKMIVTVITKIVEFLQDLLGTTAAKCRQIIKDRSLIAFDKQINVISKIDLTKMDVAIGMCKNFIDQHVEISITKVQSHAALSKVIETIETESKGIITYHPSSGVIVLVPPEFKLLTLKEAGFNINDVTQLADAFLHKTKSYTAFGAFMQKAYGDALISRLDQFSSNYEWMHCAINANASMYRVMAKAQALFAKQILAYWKCIDDSNVVVVK